MSQVPQFISEIVRAANKADKLTELEFRRLTLRAVTTIKEMRLQTGVRQSKSGDVLPAIEARCLKHEDGAADDRRDVLLEIANLMRSLKIILDAKAEVEGKD